MRIWKIEGNANDIFETAVYIRRTSITTHYNVFNALGGLLQAVKLLTVYLHGSTAGPMSIWAGKH